jgi:hypothetical protein
MMKINLSEKLHIQDINCLRTHFLDYELLSTGTKENYFLIQRLENGAINKCRKWVYNIAMDFKSKQKWTNNNDK